MAFMISRARYGRGCSRCRQISEQRAETVMDLGCGIERLGRGEKIEGAEFAPLAHHGLAAVVSGAAGGVGLAVVQLLKALGVATITFISSKKKTKPTTGGLYWVAVFFQ